MPQYLSFSDARRLNDLLETSAVEAISNRTLTAFDDSNTMWYNSGSQGWKKKEFVFLIPWLTCISIEEKMRGTMCHEKIQCMYWDLSFISINLKYFLLKLVYLLFQRIVSMVFIVIAITNTMMEQAQCWGLGFYHVHCELCKKNLMQKEYTLFIILHNHNNNNSNNKIVLVRIAVAVPSPYPPPPPYKNIRHCPLQAMFLLKCLRKRARAHRPRDIFLFHSARYAAQLLDGDRV